MADHEVDAVIFDVDGTLIDSRELIRQAIEDTLDNAGYSVPPRAEIDVLVGTSFKEMYEYFAPGSGATQLIKNHDDFHIRNCDIAAPYPGVYEMLEELQAADIRLGAFSSSNDGVLASMNHTGITQYFDIIVRGSEVKNHKPHPEGLIRALGSLSIAPERAVMVGDSIYDIMAGERACVAITIGVTHGFGARLGLEDVGATHVVDSLAEIPPLLLNHRD